VDAAAAAAEGDAMKRFVMAVVLVVAAAWLSATYTPQPTLTTVTAAASANTTSSSSALVDITGASISLSPGRWMIFGSAAFNNSISDYLVLQVTTSSNTVVATAQDTVRASNEVIQVSTPVAIVTPAATTTYKLRFQTGNSTTIARQNDSVIGNSVTAITAVKVGS
jgi:hypothetical protein